MSTQQSTGSGESLLQKIGVGVATAVIASMLLFVVAVVFQGVIRDHVVNEVIAAPRFEQRVEEIFEPDLERTARDLAETREELSEQIREAKEDLRAFIRAKTEPSEERQQELRDRVERLLEELRQLERIVRASSEPSTVQASFTKVKKRVIYQLSGYGIGPTGGMCTSPFEFTVEAKLVDADGSVLAVNRARFTASGSESADFQRIEPATPFALSAIVPNDEVVYLELSGTWQGAVCGGGEFDRTAQDSYVMLDVARADPHFLDEDAKVSLQVAKASNPRGSTTFVTFWQMQLEEAE